MRIPPAEVPPKVVDWLLEGDPAIRWQVERDLLDEPPAVWEATRARTATEGFGAALLAHQDADGRWAGGAHFPGEWTREMYENEPQPWTATSWSLRDLREWGVPASALDDPVLGSTAARLDASCRWEYEDLPFWDGEVDVCINAMTLAAGAWLGVDAADAVPGGAERLARLAAWFPEHLLADGGWNCENTDGGTSDRSSFHSTLNAVRGLLAYEQILGERGVPVDDAMRAVRTARRSGEAYLLERRLLYRLRDEAPVGAFATALVHPSRYRYHVLGALDVLRASALHDGTDGENDGRFDRCADAIAVVRAARFPDGRWRQGRPLAGRVWFDVDAAEGEPSRWLTLMGWRVLRWWDVTAATARRRPH